MSFFSSLGLVPLLCRSSVGGEHTKNTAYAFVHTGVWHNPRKQKQKQYIPKYALTDCQLFPLISCQTYVCTDWFVSIIYVRCGVATELSADNRLQRYNKKSNYTNKSIFCCHFFASRTQIAYSRNVLLNSERVTNLS